MPCAKLPEVPLPTLPAPLTLGAPLPPPLPGVPEFCCKLPKPDFLKKTPKIPKVSKVINPTLLKTLNGYIEVLQTYLHSRPLKCPLE